MALCLVLPLTSAPASAQQSAEAKLRTERAHLDQLRAQRDSLQQRMSRIQGDVHDLSEEMANLDRQADVTARVVQSLDAQLGVIGDQIDSTTTSLVRAEDELTVKRATLRHRVREIYKRGPLYSVEVLLSAATFGDLVSRYKYLHLLTLRDRSLVRRVEELRDQIGLQRNNLVTFQNDVQINLSEKADEQQHLRELQRERGRSLSTAKQQVRETAARLKQIAKDEDRLTNVIASLEAARRRAESRGGASGTSTLKTSDFGNLAWPTQGDIIYSFGRVVNPNNTTTRWNGIGIAAPEGAAVHAVEAGRVVVAEQFGTYGLTVILQHGGGDYSVYGSLGSLKVKKGDVVSKGQVLGTVGVSDPALPPHLHFEIRPGGHAVDPLEWLRKEAR
ncbi:MAG TPA: peptidoglycan DD-metalloendopeptidase family protein [Gemmatimonadaceae bacterium]|nr:peptidoglycan DD-metalloendopeptidase family protein [Gemmatimonadaceae bacterium]